MNPPSIRTTGILAVLLTVCGGCSDADRNQDTGSPQTTPTAAAANPASADITAGEQALAQGNYQVAVDRFTQAIADGRQDQLPNPGAAEAKVYHQRGVAYLRMGFPDTAVQDFSAALNLAPDSGRTYQDRAAAFVELGDSYKAIRDATQAIRLTPDNADAYRIRGEVYLSREQYDRAAADLQYAVEQQPGLSAQVGPLLALAYSKWSDELATTGDQAAAAEKMALATKLDPSLGAKEGASPTPPPPAVEQTVAKPVIDEAEKNFTEGREHQLAGESDQAIISYTKAIALRTDFHEAYLRRGETLLRLGFPDTALEDFKRADHRGADSVEVSRLEARAHMALDNPHRAALAATEALHDDPTDAATYALRGQAYFAMEIWDRAVADLEEAIRRDPKLTPSLDARLATARQRLSEAHVAKQQAPAGA